LDEYSYCLTDGVTLENVSENDLTEEDFSSDPTRQIIVSPKYYADSQKIDVLPLLRQKPAQSDLKNTRWIYLVTGILMASVAVMGYLLFKPAATENNPTIHLNPDGRWKGEWTSPNGNLYVADVNINDEKANNFTGQIVYTLKQTGTHGKDKIGATAIEHIEGTFNPTSRLLQAKGVREDDPKNIIVLDKYQLTLSEDNQTLSGSSQSGQFNLKRQ